jgi:hypothetical protein
LENLKGRDLSEDRRRFEDNIRMGVREIVREVVDWIHLAQNRDQWWALVNIEMNFWGSVKGREILTS